MSRKVLASPVRLKDQDSPTFIAAAFGGCNGLAVEEVGLAEEEDEEDTGARNTVTPDAAISWSVNPILLNSVSEIGPS